MVSGLSFKILQKDGVYLLARSRDGLFWEFWNNTKDCFSSVGTPYTNLTILGIDVARLIRLNRLTEDNQIEILEFENNFQNLVDA